jgi:hypothetical protein
MIEKKKVEVELKWTNGGPPGYQLDEPSEKQFKVTV